MRRLILLRHAKSDRPPGVADIDRPLNPRGRRAAPAVGAYLQREALVPDLALVSPARRTRETWEAAAGALGPVPSRIVDAIYEAPPEALLAAVRAAPDTAETVVLVGHNPGIQALAESLAGHGAGAARFPTAALAVIAFEAEAWSAVAADAGRLERFVTPKEIAADEDA